MAEDEPIHETIAAPSRVGRRGDRIGDEDEGEGYEPDESQMARPVPITDNAVAT